MFKTLYARFVKDVKQRRNLELYLTLVAIVAVLIGDIYGLKTSEALFEVTLATLAVLLYSTLNARHLSESTDKKLNEIVDTVSQISKSNQEFFDNTWPSLLEREMEQTEELWLVGVSLVRTVKTYYSLLEKKLDHGHLVKVLLINPIGVGVEVAVARNYGKKDVEQKSRDIIRTLSDLCELRKAAVGRLEIKTTQHPLAYGAIVVSPNSTANGRIYVENYGYRVKSEGFPRFTLYPSHADWYEFYRNELIFLWEDAEKWPCKE